MASVVYIQVSGPSGSFSGYKSCTEGSVGELVDQVSGLSLGEVWEGKTINGFQGEYQAGTCLAWVEDNRTKERFLLGCVNKTTGGGTMEYIGRPFRVTKDMVLNAMTQAVA